MGRLTPLLSPLAPLAVVALASSALPSGTAQEAVFFVDTASDLPFDAAHCTPDNPCPLRSALALAEGQRAVVRACYDPEEVGGGPPCPEGASPLSKSDPGYDAERDRWVIVMDPDLAAFTLLEGSVTVDFTLDIEGWSGPEDNRIVISNPTEQDYGILVESAGNVLAGFEISGRFAYSAIDVRLEAGGNQLGPGLILSDIGPGIGIRIRDSSAPDNRVVGNWCGISGDGSVAMPVAGDCIVLTRGTSGNVIGGEEPSDRNVLAASEGGSAVVIDGGTGAGTRANVVQGNLIGTDAGGQLALGTDAGVRIIGQAMENRIVGNVIGACVSDGIVVTDRSYGTVIEDNSIGVQPDGDVRLGNAGYGVRVLGGAMSTTVVRNRVQHNGAGGIHVTGGTTSRTLVTMNRVTANGGKAIVVTQGANGGVQPPRLLNVSEAEVTGLACGQCVVEIYSDPAGEADEFEGSLTALLAGGLFTFAKPEGFLHGYIAATLTDINGNTSGLSEAKWLPERPTPTASATVATPGPSPTTPLAGGLALLPWLGRDAGR